MTPFSGLSLVFHLGIIALSTTAEFFGFTRNRTKGYDPTHPRVMSILNPIVSILILGTVGGVTLTFIATALETGIEAGSDEPIRMFITEHI